jgi:diguanylate cyclase (GGDEF)-like protein
MAAALALTPFLVACLLGCAAAGPPKGAKTPVALRGVLDLRDWDFEVDGPIALAGEWDFFPGRLLSADEAATAEGAVHRSVPDAWKGSEAGGTAGRGAGTYRLSVLLGRPRGDLALRYTTVATAFELDANGRRVAGSGRPAVDSETAVPAYRPGLQRLPGPASRIDLVMRVSNHEYRVGGMWRALVLGPEGRLVAEKRDSNSLILVLFGAASAIALNSLCLFLFRRKDLDYLFFALFALCVALRSLVTGDYLLVTAFPRISFGLLIRLEYLSAVTPIPFAVLFVGAVFPEEIGRRGLAALCLPFALLLLVLIAPLPILTRSIFVFYPVAVGVMVATLVLVFARAAIHCRSGGVLLFAGSIVLFAAALNDILFSAFLIHTGNYLVGALTIFLFLQALVLARRFTAAFDKVEVLSIQLARSNEGLEEEVRERTKDLKDAYSRIKELSIRDPLTEAFNRRYLDSELLDEVRRALRYGSALSVIFCDFDFFKDLNDRHGHAAGDAALAAFVRCAVETMRSKIDWIARYGGEEFFVVVPGTGPAAAMSLAERLRRRAAAQPIKSGDALVPFTLSFGVAGIPERVPGIDGSSALGTEPERGRADALVEMLFRAADSALYAAKAGGRNRVVLAEPVALGEAGADSDSDDDQT